LVPCPDCGAALKAANLDDHLRTKCPKNPARLPAEGDVTLPCPAKSKKKKAPTEESRIGTDRSWAGCATVGDKRAWYKLFSHRSYLVVPNRSSADDLGRLEALCPRVGVGLVLFNADDKSNPDFSIRVRAARSDPEGFYINRNLKLIEEKLFR
jgi:hypothetical protein